MPCQPVGQGHRGPVPEAPLGWDDVQTDRPARPVTSVRCAMSARPNRAAPDIVCEFKLGLQGYE
ncbi:BQ5605_C031g10901 [Microbotryum silenes-dioicae]|uniref:BQ5605_C031g10901 protein n=1 Tax=Microbotryum silenes-dioicae TaxID=796604 RepID=A0A2X0PHT2_9BASI|nr:BQ5605_C031g10901 [Microbotryum silenes-dioicae]